MRINASEQYKKIEKHIKISLLFLIISIIGADKKN